MKEVYKTRECEFDFPKKEIRMYRNKFNYFTMPFSDVHFIEIKKSRIVKNFWVVVLFTCSFFLFSLVLANNLFLKLIEVNNYDPLNHSDIRRIGANILLCTSIFLFSLFLFNSIRKREVILKINRKKGPFRLRELSQDGILDQFVKSIKNHFESVNVDL